MRKNDPRWGNCILERSKYQALPGVLRRQSGIWRVVLQDTSVKRGVLIGVLCAHDNFGAMRSARVASNGVRCAHSK